MSKSYRLQHSVDYLENYEARLQSMGRDRRSRKRSLETWTALASLGACVCRAWGVIFKLHLWFCGCHFRLATNCPPPLSVWKYPTFCQVFLVVNLTRRIKMQFEGIFKREYCFPSRFYCQNWFCLQTTPLSARYLHFPSSGLQFGECTRGHLVLVSSCLSGSQFLPLFMRGLRSGRTHDWKARLKHTHTPPASAGDVLQNWAPSLSCLLQI